MRRRERLTDRTVASRDELHFVPFDVIAEDNAELGGKATLDLREDEVVAGVLAGSRFGSAIGRRGV